MVELKFDVRYQWGQLKQPSTPRLVDGSRVAVLGGGPAGSFFSYFALDMAERLGIELQLDIYEPRDFSLPAPQGCNMCAGVISESLVQNLATEGINLPSMVVQRAIDSYVMHTDVGSLRIETPIHEKRIATLFRSAGPANVEEIKWKGFDAYLLSLAEDKGANVIKTRITGVKRADNSLSVETRSDPPQTYDLLAVASGVNTAALKLFEDFDFNYRPPKTTKTAIREYFLGHNIVEQYLGNSLNVFLLDIPRLDFAMIVPKGDYATVCMLGSDVDENMVRAFLNAPEVKQCFPPDWQWDRPNCKCFPRINVQGMARPFGDRIVFIGDSGVTRLYKDGIGTAYRAAKAAAATAVFEGISADDFRKHYWPICRSTHVDNQYGRVIFTITGLIQHIRFSRRALLQMAGREQNSAGAHPYMSSILWDTFTGNAPYKNIFFRTLIPAFLTRFARDLAWSLFEV